MEYLLNLWNRLLRLFPELQSPLYLKAFLKWLTTEGREYVTQFIQNLKIGFSRHLSDYVISHLGEIVLEVQGHNYVPTFTTRLRQFNFQDPDQERLFGEFVGNSQTVFSTRDLSLYPVIAPMTVEYMRLVKMDSLVCTPCELMVALNDIYALRLRKKPEELSQFQLICFLSLRPSEAKEDDVPMLLIHFPVGEFNFWSEFLGGKPVPSPDTSIIEGVHVICPVNR